MADLFSAAESEAAARAGMAHAAENRRALLAFARGLALADPQRETNADAVQAALAARGISVFALGSAAGSLFVGKEWEWTGRYVKSTRVHAHRNLLRTWRYIGPAAEKSAIDL